MDKKEENKNNDYDLICKVRVKDKEKLQETIQSLNPPPFPDISDLIKAYEKAFENMSRIIPVFLSNKKEG